MRESKILIELLLLIVAALAFCRAAYAESIPTARRIRYEWIACAFFVLFVLVRLVL